MKSMKSMKIQKKSYSAFSPFMLFMVERRRVRLVGSHPGAEIEFSNIAVILQYDIKRNRRKTGYSVSIVFAMRCANWGW
jgi:hypothetical protein